VQASAVPLIVLLRAIQVADRGARVVGKVMTMEQAIGRFVPDRSSVLIGAALESLIPFAAGHELIRQQRRHLTLVGPVSDVLFDQLIGAGCVAKVVAAWVGNVSAGLAHNYRRAVEQGLPHPLDVVEHSNFTLALGLLDGPSAIVTTLGVFTFDPVTKEAVVSSRHPGVTVDDIRDNTGWPVRLSAAVHETPPPSDEELAVIRRHDPDGFWTGRGRAGERARGPEVNEDRGRGSAVDVSRSGADRVGPPRKIG
jgi:hypothetical protein